MVFLIGEATLITTDLSILLWSLWIQLLKLGQMLSSFRHLILPCLFLEMHLNAIISFIGDQDSQFEMVRSLELDASSSWTVIIA